MFLIFLVSSLIFPTICLAEDSIFVWSSETKQLKNDTVQTNAIPNSLSLDCGSCILIEQHSGQILYEQNMHEKLRPASVTKVMTLLLIMEAIDSRKIVIFR